jgi:hypothetical protein
MTEQLSTATTGTHPETGLYHADLMPPAENETLRAVREKQLAGVALNMTELMRAGRDTTVDAIGEYELKPDHVYRAVGRDALEAYQLHGMVVATGEEDDEFIEGLNNAGVDWFLGGAAPKYGSVVLETPADPDYFVPAHDNGHALAKDPKVRHMKSSGRLNPVPMDKVRVIEVPPVKTTDGEQKESVDA